mmetsp:Transcript_26755/g.62462  ORF Transcript_26755/g.62462 Transcript_26755/m.62462 type:complete len:144 (-) Transcript_26755:506-937(-)
MASSMASASWSCAACTFANCPLLPFCEMCETPKPAAEHCETPKPAAEQAHAEVALLVREDGRVAVSIVPRAAPTAPPQAAAADGARADFAPRPTAVVIGVAVFVGLVAMLLSRNPGGASRVAKMAAAAMAAMVARSGVGGVRD